MKSHTDLPIGIQHVSVDAACVALDCCRATVCNAIAEYDKAVAAGLPPPPGSLKYVPLAIAPPYPGRGRFSSSLASGNPAAPIPKTRNLPFNDSPRRDDASEEKIHGKRKPRARKSGGAPKTVHEYSVDESFVSPTLAFTQEQFDRELAQLREANRLAYSRKSPWAGWS